MLTPKEEQLVEEIRAGLEEDEDLQKAALLEIIDRLTQKQKPKYNGKTFRWTEEDFPKLVPGAKVDVHWSDVGRRTETIVHTKHIKSGLVALDGHPAASLELCDPASIAPPEQNT